MTRKPLGPKGRMEKGPQVTCKPSGPTGRMQKGSTGTRRMEKGPSEDFYDELQASWMSNCRSHRYTSGGERTVWRFMTRCRSLQIENFVIDV